jgi:hypothetical protein
MSEFTKRGHKLKHERDLVFACVSQYVVWSQGDGFRKGDDTLLSFLQVVAPATRGQVVRTVLAWASAYNDEELIAQAPAIVDEAFAKLAAIPAPDPAAPAPKQQGSLN